MFPQPIGEPFTLEGTPASPPAQRVVETFAEALRNLLEEVRAHDAQATALKQRLLMGEPVELHEVLLAVEKAHLSFQMLLAVRNRLLEAYQELMRMPL